MYVVHIAGPVGDVVGFVQVLHEFRDKTNARNTTHVYVIFYTYAKTKINA